MSTPVFENDWRAPLVDTASRIAAGAGLLWFTAYFVSVPTLRWEVETAIIAGSLVVVWVGALGRRLPEGIRMAALLQVLVVPVTVALSVAPPGAGAALMFALVALLGSLFYGRRAGLAVMGGIFFIYLVAGAAWKYGVFPIRPADPLNRPQEVAYWVRVLSGQILGTGALVAVSVYMVRHATRVMGKLRQGENLLRAIVGDQTEMIVRWKPDGMRTFVNKAYAHFKGRPAEELVGTSFMPELSEQARQVQQARIRELSPENPVVTCVFEEVSRNGGRAAQEWTERGIFSEGRLVEIQSTGRDITARRQAEENLRMSEQRLRTIIEAGNDGIWEWEVEADTIVWSDRVYEMLGMQPGGPALGLAQIRELIHPDDREGFDRAINEHIKNGTAYDIELHIRRGGGGYGFFHCRGKTLRAADGRPLRMIGSISDVTERRRMQEVIAMNETLLRQFVKYTPAAVAMFDTQMRYLQASDRWIADYHLGRENVTGRSHYDLCPDVPERWKDLHRRVLAGAVERCEEDPVQRADGNTEWLHWEVRPWHKAGGEIGGLIMFTQVITGRKLTERKIADQLAELQRWQRITFGREERISQLKGEVNELCRRLGRPAVYSVQGSAQPLEPAAGERNHAGALHQ